MQKIPDVEKYPYAVIVLAPINYGSKSKLITDLELWKMLT